MILSYLRTIILHLVLLLVIRLMGKRQIGQMEPSEFVVTMMVANRKKQVSCANNASKESSVLFAVKTVPSGDAVTIRPVLQRITTKTDDLYYHDINQYKENIYDI